MPGLFTPLKIKGRTLNNRIVVPPMATGLATESGEVTDDHIEHYVRFAKAGVGTVILEHAYVQGDGRLRQQQLGIHDDSLIPGLRRLADAIRAQGSVVGVQINHGAGKTTSGVIGRRPISASEVLVPGGSETARAVTTAELLEIIAAFGAAAQRAKAAGMDFVEIHSAHGYLLNQFLSPLTNQRTDAYGGDLQNRLHLPLQVVRTVRQAVGDDYLVLYRLGANDFMTGGLTQAEGKQVALAVVKAGVDLLDISGGLYGASVPGWDQVSQGYFIPMAAEIRAAANVPVVNAGGITEPRYADCVIRDGKVDLVAVGRAMLENPDWALDARRTLQDESPS